MRLLQTFRRLLRDQRGATVVEYAVLCALIFFAIMTTVSGLATENSQMFGRIGSTMSRATAA